MPSNSNPQLILASQSPRRKELLARTGAKFSVIVSDVPEISDARDPKIFALEIARLKGAAVLKLRSEVDTCIVSCDTVVALGDKIYGKPSSRSEARQFLQELSGKKHWTHTGLVIHINGQRFEAVESTEVEFAPISEYLLERYIDSGDSLDKAGAYGIQGDALAFITGIKGCYSSVMGFPLARFCAMMEGQVASTQGWDKPWQNYFS